MAIEFIPRRAVGRERAQHGGAVEAAADVQVVALGKERELAVRGGDLGCGPMAGPGKRKRENESTSKT